ncbi:2437_t:CDS:1, partial [Ambispora leptoticha]
MVDDVSTGLVTKTLSPSHPIPKWKTICRRIKRAADGDGKCPECEKPRVSYWCQQCESKRLRRKFNEWTSGNENIDKFLQSTQFNAPRH